MSSDNEPTYDLTDVPTNELLKEFVRRHQSFVYVGIPLIEENTHYRKFFHGKPTDLLGLVRMVDMDLVLDIQALKAKRNPPQEPM